VKCNYCGGEVIYDAYFSEWVCSRCGVVIDPRPIDCSELYSHPELKYYAKNGGARVSWLISATEHVKSLSSVAYSSDCTFETAVKLVYEIYHSHVKPLPPAEDTAKFAVLVASRLCGEVVSFEKLFSSARELSLLLRHSALRRLYKPPSTKELALDIVVKAAKCLEERGVRVDYSALELIDKFTGMGLKPRTIAILVLYKTTGSKLYLAECLGVSHQVICNAVKKHSTLF
jgi:hypothetical protein